MAARSVTMATRDCSSMDNPARTSPRIAKYNLTFEDYAGIANLPKHIERPTARPQARLNLVHMRHPKPQVRLVWMNKRVWFTCA